MLERIDKRIKVGIIGAAVVTAATFGGIKAVETVNKVKDNVDKQNCRKEVTPNELNSNKIQIDGKTFVRCYIETDEKTGLKTYKYAPEEQYRTFMKRDK